VRLPTQHAQILVSGGTGQFHDVEAFLEQAGGGLVSQVVKTEVLEAGTAGGAAGRGCGPFRAPRLSSGA